MTEQVAAPPAWSTACPDWRERIKTGRSIIPPPIFPEEGEAGLAVMRELKIVDAPGSPTIGEACAPWVFELAASIFGAYDGNSGKRLITEWFVCVPKKNSKALALDTLVATPSGFSTMGALRPGDMVLDALGRPTPVLAKSEVFVGHQCYELEFSTGEKVVCDAGHLWVTDAHRERDQQGRSARKNPLPRAKTTAEIASTLKVPSGKYVINNHRTALCAPLELPDADLPIPPYVLGAWLGDGSSAAAVITAGADAADHMVAQLRAAGHSARIAGYSSCGAARISIAEERGSRVLPYRFSVEARKLGILNNKHIPQIYLRASVAQRLELLRGLMDTDGTITKRGQASYATTCRALRDGVVELLNSLGFKASAPESRATLNGKDCGPVWGVQFWPYDTVAVCTLQKKLDRQRAATRTNAPRSCTRQIVAAREVPSVPTQCIAVASDTRQFLVTRSLIPTHNSSIAAAVMLTALIRNWRESAEYIILSPTVEVASNSFGPASDMVRKDEELEELMHVQAHVKTITHRNSRANLKVVAADSNTVGGKKAVGILIDEAWLFGKMANAENMLREATGGLASRDEGFIIWLTTQSDDPPAGVFKQKLDYARDVRDGKIVDPRFVPVIYEFPEDMIESKAYANPDNWGMVIPNMGRSVNKDFLTWQFSKDQAAGEQSMRGFWAKYLNVEIGLALRSDRWAGAEFWEAQHDKTLTLDTFLERCEVIVAGIDGGGLDDLLGLVLMGRERGTGKWLHWAHAWAHRIVLERRKDIAPALLDFSKAGELTIVEQPGQDVIDVADILCRVRDLQLLPEKQCIGVDAAGIGDIVTELTSEARKFTLEEIVAISQGWKLNGAIKTTERSLAGKELWHCGQGVMAFAVGNARTVAVGNAITINKQVSGSAKIDPLMATFDCVTLLSLNPKARQKKFQSFFVGGQG